MATAKVAGKTASKTAAKPTRKPRTRKKGITRLSAAAAPAVPGFVPSLSASGPPSGKMVGSESQVYYTPAGGASTLFANIIDFDLDIKADSIDVSDRSTLGWKDKRTGLKEWSGSMKATAIQLGVSFEDFFDAITGGTTMTGNFRPQDVTAGLAFAGSFVITTFKYSAPGTGAQTIDIGIEGRGPLVRGTVTAGGTA